MLGNTAFNFFKKGLLNEGTLPRYRKINRINFVLSDNIYTADWNGTSIKFYTSETKDLGRAKTCGKEPMTEKWIDSFNSEDVFWDIGANVGVYSLYAAFRVGCKVFSFEPVYHNYNILNRNIAINNMGENITAYCFSLHDKFEIDKIHLRNLYSGSSGSDFSIKSNETSFSQGSLGFPIDDLVDHIAFPNHIKIDVDGNEKFIVKGMSKTLSNDNLKSVLIEINQSYESIIDIFKEKGYKIFNKALLQVLDDGNKTINYIFKKS